MARSRRARGSAQGARDGAQRAQLAGLQRARMLSAMFDVCHERGAGSVSVAHVVERSGVSRRTFYEQFADREDCFFAAFEQALAFASARALPAYAAERTWRERIRAGLVALLSFLDEEPVIGRVLIVESLAGGSKTLERRREAIAQLTRVIDEGRTEAKGETVSPLTPEGVVGGVLAVIQARLMTSGRAGASRSRTQEAWRAQHASDRGRRDAPPMVALTNQLMGMIVLPYLGSAAVRRELERPPPAPVPAERDGSLLLDPFKDAGMRLTYRTVRVLLAIAGQPGASNRHIGETAGITDQGQISKLLARLERIGLVSNTGLGHGKGGPNAWTLTEKGRKVTDGIRAHTEGSQSHGAGER